MILHLCRSICFNLPVTDITTRQLMFTSSPLVVPYSTSRISFGFGVGDISWNRLNCVGNENNLTQCSSDTSFDLFCDHYDDVGVLCPRKMIILLYSHSNIMSSLEPNASCADGDVRLSGGRISSEGFVEICFNGHWGTICHNGWDENDANVLCGELGFVRNGQLAISLCTIRVQYQ